MKTVRDEQLGAVLRELHAPEHRPEFHAELHRRLASTRAVRAPRRRPGLRWPARVVAVAAVLALAVVAFETVRPTGGDLPTIVQPADAAVVKASVQLAFTQSRSLSGTFVSREREPETGATDTARGTFVLLADGSFRVRTGKIVEAYDARRRVSTLYDANPGFEPFAHKTRGLSAGAPDSYVDSSFQRELGSVVRALLAVGNIPVENGTKAGRPVWTLSTPVREDRLAGEGWSPDHLTVSVDKETGIPLYARWTVDGKLRRQLEITAVEVNPDVSRGDLAVEIPEDVAVGTSDQGFRRVELGEAEGIVGYAPLVPGTVPEGYELADVMVARQGGPTGAEGMNPQAPGVVSLLYRRGFDRIVVTTRVAGDGEWADPLATGEGFVDRPEPIRLERGALSGVEANLLIVPLAIPHIWAITDELVVTIAGDLTREELLRAAESLEPRP